MNDENTEDNNSEQTDNKVEETKEPNFPDQESDQPEQEEVETESLDPEMSKWMEETGSLENAYKRIQGSREEVENYQKKVEELEQAHTAYQQQLAAELQEVYNKDPETASKLFGVQTEQTVDQANDTQHQVSPDDIARQVQAEVEKNRFYDNNREHFSNDDEWVATQDLALSFVGKNDREGKPYTIQTALRDALLIRKPELVGDQAISDHLTSEAKRASASETGDLPGGGASDEDLGEEYDEVAKQMGVKITPEVRKRIKNRRRRKQEAAK